MLPQVGSIYKTVVELRARAEGMPEACYGIKFLIFAKPMDNLWPIYVKCFPG